jgi:hypothetical protein
MGPLKRYEFTPPRKSSEPLGASLKPNMEEDTAPPEKRVWNGGFAK